MDDRVPLGDLAPDIFAIFQILLHEGVEKCWSSRPGWRYGLESYKPSFSPEEKTPGLPPGAGCRVLVQNNLVRGQRPHPVKSHFPQLPTAKNIGLRAKKILPVIGEGGPHRATAIFSVSHRLPEDTNMGGLWKKMAMAVPMLKTNVTSGIHQEFAHPETTKASAGETLEALGHGCSSIGSINWKPESGGGIGVKSFISCLKPNHPFGNENEISGLQRQIVPRFAVFKNP